MSCVTRTVLVVSLLAPTGAWAGGKGEIQYLGEGRYACTGSRSFDCQQFNARESQRQDAIRREQRREDEQRYELRRRDMERYLEQLERGSDRAGGLRDPRDRTLDAGD